MKSRTTFPLLFLFPVFLFAQSANYDCDRQLQISSLKEKLTKSENHAAAYELSRLYQWELNRDSSNYYYRKAIQSVQNDSIRDYYSIRKTNEDLEFIPADSITEALQQKYDSLHPYTGLILQKKADILMFQSNYKSALPLLNRSQSILSAYREEFDREFILCEVGRMACLGNTNQVDSALSIGRKLDRHMRANYAPCEYLYARLSISMAMRFDELNEPDSVALYLARGEATLKNYYLDNDPLYKLLYSQLADHHHTVGRSNLAIENYLKAEQIALLSMEKNRKFLSNTYNRIASIYRDVLSNQKALQYFNKSIKMLQGEYGENKLLLLAPYTNMGVSMMAMEEYEEASYYLDQALSYAVELKGENHIYTAIITGAVASNASESGDFSKAEPAFLRSLKIRNELYGRSSIRHANIYVNMSVMYRNMKLYDKAQMNLESALEIYLREQGEGHPEVSGIYNRIGILYTLQDKNTEATQAFGKGMQVGNMDKRTAESYDRTTHISLLKNRAKAYLNMYQKSGELPHLELAQADLTLGALVLKETLANKIYTDAADEIIGRYRDLFETSIDVLYEFYVRSGDISLINKAWELSDRSKSTSIRQALAEISSVKYFGLEQSLLDEIRNTNSKLVAFQAKRKTDLINESADSTVLYQQQLDSLDRALKESSPEYYQLQQSDVLVSLPDMQKDLLKNEIILDYFFTEKNLYVFSLTSTEQDLTAYPCLESFRDSIDNYITSIGDPGTEDRWPKTKRWLSKTVSEQSKSAIKYVKIIPDGALTYLPFESLEDENGKLLIEDYAISYGHSLSVLNYQKQKPAVRKRYNFAGFAPIYEENSVDTTVQPKYAMLVRSGGLPLPSAQGEVSEIKKLIGGRIYKGNAATKGKFLEMLDQTKIAHLSMHTLIDAGNPLNSRFLFNDTSGGIEDLYLYELYNLQSNIELAVLSACETSLGRSDFSGTPNSLSNALAYSGIPATVTSMWKVPDESTSDIMIAFYEHLKAGQRKDDALRLAKLDYLKNVRSVAQKNPLYWAGFVAVGNMNAMTFTSSFNLWWLVAFLVFMSILLFVVKKSRAR